MCGRYYIPDDDDFSEIIAMINQIKEENKGSPILSEMKLGEIFPTDVVPVITSTTPQLMKWGFSRFDGKGIIINARLESVSTKPMFQYPYKAQRCLIPAGYYFEWKKDGSKKQKYAIRQEKPIYMAGIYQMEKTSDIPLFVILTKPAITEIEFIHDRMPVILPEVAREKWLRGDIGVPEITDIDFGKLEFESIC